MMIARSGSYVFLLLEILCAVGEIPVSALPLLGNTRSVKAVVHEGEMRQTIRADCDGREYQARLFCISGRGRQKTLRLSKEAVPLLTLLHPDAAAHYLAASHNHHFSGSEEIIERNHRVAETAIMCLMAGAEFRSYRLPELQFSQHRNSIGESACCYLSRNIKGFAQSSMAKVVFSRATGLLFTPDQPYVLYNARTSVMKWSGAAESKAQLHFTEVVLRNSRHKRLEGAILFADNGLIALETVLQTMQSQRTDMSFVQVYPHIHFVPISPDGIQLLRLLMLPNARERMLEALLPDEFRFRNGSRFSCDCDGVSNDGRYILSHLDGDVARLIHFRSAAFSMPETAFEVICYPWQLAYVQPYLKDRIAIRCIEPSALEAAIQ